MTRLFNDPAAFADEATDGFVRAFGAWVQKVSGGVIRRTKTPEPTVSVVIGGGSGHYPAFGGLVGPGLAHGAALGNLFASPSAQQVHAVAKAAEHGRGLLLSYGNYAGDVLNFDAAQEQLRNEGIECETVVVTDDISSAPASDRAKRRGIAGDLTVFKVAAAAAEQGADLADVVRVARLANERTRSFGVAFTGCTLPGASEPLFTVPEGRMAVGMGIHGEPGIDETDVPSADGLAQLLVSSLIAESELPDGVDTPRGARVAVLLNGLGSVKYEELFVVYNTVGLLLEDAGITIVEPEVGELVTSFDMAGVSLTLFWLDDELESFWAAPADAPAYRKGSVAQGEQVAETYEAVDVAATVPEASDDSRAAASQAVAVIAAIAAVIDANSDELGRIDAVAGDGDHGIGMKRGSFAAEAAAADFAERGAGAGSVLTAAADAWADKAGGTSGALWGIALHAVADALGDEKAPDAAAVSAGVAAAKDGIMRFGKAVVGDKTMVDVLVPFSDALARAVETGSPLAGAWLDATIAAEEAAAATAQLRPVMGRARSHVERSLGTPDAGAVSLALIVRAVLPVLER
jgi:dihydroxyacetone kinase